MIWQIPLLLEYGQAFELAADGRFPVETTTMPMFRTAADLLGMFPHLTNGWPQLYVISYQDYTERKLVFGLDGYLHHDPCQSVTCALHQKCSLLFCLTLQNMQPVPELR